MKKVICLGLIFLSFFALFLRFGLKPLLESIGFNPKAGIRVTAIPEAIVFLDGIEVGQTPYQNENLKVKGYEVELKANGSLWKGIVKLTPGTLSVVNRELAPYQSSTGLVASIASSSGEILTLSRGKGVVLTSNPSEASVEVNGKFYGKTPLTITDLEPGEHTFQLSFRGYLKRNIRASLPAGMNLSLNVDLAISEADLGTIASGDGRVGAYSNTPVAKVTVKQTPTGFLRVRDKPSTKGRELAKVSPGEELIVLEDLAGWVRVKLKDGTEGYVSSSYVLKQP